jgi:hypothetical protein
MGRIEVYVEEVVGVRRLLWSLAGEQSQHAWKKAAIPLQVTTAFKVKFLFKRPFTRFLVRFFSFDGCERVSQSRMFR